jgi:hypothetical protein
MQQYCVELFLRRPQESKGPTTNNFQVGCVFTFCNLKVNVKSEIFLKTMKRRKEVRNFCTKRFAMWRKYTCKPIHGVYCFLTCFGFIYFWIVLFSYFQPKTILACELLGLRTIISWGVFENNCSFVMRIKMKMEEKGLSVTRGDFEQGNYSL